MKELLVFRHAKAVDSSESPTDHERDLKPKGEKAAVAMGVLLAERKLLPDLVLTSDAVRAQRTATLCVEEFPARVDVLSLEALYDCEVTDYRTIIGRQPEVVSRLMVVGHNPTLQELVEGLTGIHVDLKTCSIARISLPVASWRELDDLDRGTVEEMLVT